MKQMVVFFMVFILSCGFVLAEPQAGDSGDSGSFGVGDGTPGTNNNSSQGTGGSDAAGSGQQVNADIGAQNKGDDNKLVVQAKQQVKAQSMSELKQMIQQKQQQMNQQQEMLGKAEQNAYKNQNTVRLAVHTMLAMEDLAGGIGKNVSAIAKKFNNSIQATLRAEEKIEKKSGFARFFTGGNEKAAEDLQSEINKNKEQLQELKRLANQNQEDNEVKATLQEQVRNMELEQNRLQHLADKEKKSKGLFGWLWK